MSDYQLTASDTIIRVVDHASIPNDPANRDRAAYDVWLAAGGVPGPYVAPSAPPSPTPLEKLTAAGLSVADLKTLLGIA
jgi:hypothetical protein